MRSRSKGPPWAAPLAFLALAASPAAAQLDFPALADAWRAEHGLPEGPLGRGAMDEVLKRDFLACDLGLVDLRYPLAFLGEEERVAELRAVLAAALEVQGAWVSSAAGLPEGRRARRGPGGAAQQALEDIEELVLWIAKAEPASGARPASTGGATAGPPGWLAFFGAGKAVRERAEHLVGLLRSGQAVGFAPRGGAPGRIVLAPSREDFVQLASFLGAIEPELRGIWWQQGIATWTELWWRDLQVVALRYADPRYPFHTLRDFPMDAREATGLAEHVAQRCAVTLGWVSLGQRLDPAFELGLAQALVVDAIGRNNTRSGGALRGKVTEAYAAFIPGGNPAGGALPPNNADSRWRATLGTDWFVGPLREGQRAGAREVRDRGAETCFLLQAEAGSGVHPVRAPFFGSAARGKESPPQGFLQDYLEFFRAYKTAFLWWLRTAAEGKESRARFAELLSRLAASDPALPSGLDADLSGFEAAVLEVYRVPWSAPLDEKGRMPPSLEGRFLAWLARQ